MLVGGVGRVHRILDASLRAAVYILDIIGVLGLQLIKFIYLILDWSGLPIYPLLAGKRVHMAPETLFRLIRQRLACRVGGRIVGVHRSCGGAGCRGVARLGCGGARLSERADTECTT